MGTRYSDFNKKVGASLQRLRKAAGFKSAKAFADYVGINPSTYTDYEQGKASLSYERAWQLADAAGCTLDALGGREPPGAFLDASESELVGNYRASTPERRRLLSLTARDCAAMSKDAAERPEAVAEGVA